MVIQETMGRWGKRRWKVGRLAVAVCALAGVARGEAEEQAEDRPRTAVEIVVQQRELHEQRFGDLPLLEVNRLEEVFRLEMVEGDVVLRTPLAATAMRRAELVDLPGDVSVAVGRRPGQEQEVNSFHFQRIRFDDEASSDILTVRSSGRHVQIGKVVRTALGTQGVTLRMEREVEGTGRRGVTLQMHTLTAPGEPMQREEWEAVDLPTLYRQRPREMEKHVRPMLRELNLQWLLSPDEAMARQVLAGDYEPEERVREQVGQLLPKLDDHHAQVREQATADLKAMGPPAAAVIVRLDRDELSPEQNTRLDAVLESIRPVEGAELAGLRENPAFLVECLLIEDERIRAAALALLREAVPWPVEFDIQAERAARQQAVAELRARLR